MSIEDDMARVQAVTDKLAGPITVWVLVELVENPFSHGLMTEHVTFSKESALERAKAILLARAIQSNQPLVSLATYMEVEYRPHSWLILNQREIHT